MTKIFRPDRLDNPGVHIQGPKGVEWMKGTLYVIRLFGSTATPTTQSHSNHHPLVIQDPFAIQSASQTSHKTMILTFKYKQTWHQFTSQKKASQVQTPAYNLASQGLPLMLAISSVSSFNWYNPLLSYRFILFLFEIYLSYNQHHTLLLQTTE
ncbi:uncharacterized protein FA14DRAFT_182699 [Meira miltonrushii]|uniref:Uncharacterized protein n=1 Tax=Meira miltonrushii TaxID=1280837 RepID=A0A316V1Q3_9BASI|nr:uncharacterized protein FA14DRAFT_182699 [Meira miltonrushii]PWN31479.1 hypothetical protein FA14DRAFT_182699 [Meira miltonrushii]